MGRFAGSVLAVLLVPMGVSAGLIDYPADLADWVVTQPPRIGVDDERWFAANNDITHQWVVFLRGDRPSVRLRVPKGAVYPERQEAYPPMPFTVRQGSMKEGLAGEWFSVQVSDGWVIGFNQGEWGGALWWFSPDGKTRYKISGDQVIGFFKTDAGLLALEEGISHGTTSRGRIVRLTRGGDGRWHSEPFVDLGGVPETAVMGADGTLTVATNDRLLRVHVGTRKLDVLLRDAFWGGLFPRSMIVAPSGTVYLGMRHGVARVEKTGTAYEARWLLPNTEFDRVPESGFR